MKRIVNKGTLIGKLVVSLLLFAVFAFDLLPFLELRAEDIAYRSAGMVDPTIAVIGIDESAIEKFGNFTRWSRATMADAINILNSDPENKPAVIGVDILFIGGSDNIEADNALAKACRDGGNVVTASQAFYSEDLSNNKVITMVETPYPALAQSTAHGLVNATFDGDGTIRRALLKTKFEGEDMFSFPAEIYRKYKGQNPYADANDEMYINYSGRPGEYYSGYSFADIFDPDFDPAFFAGSIVLIGPYASAMMDAYNTPMSATEQMHGVEIHANAIQTMIEEKYQQRVPFWDYAIFLFMLICAMLVSGFVDIRILFVIMSIFSAIYYFMAIHAYNSGYILVMLYPILAVAVTLIYNLAGGYIVETVEKQKLRGVFIKYIDPGLVDKLVASGEAHSEEVGAERDIAVMFVDIRGFTPISEALRDQPEQVVKILNEYLQLTCDHIFENGGSIDKFIGDATMALFNGFMPLEDYEYKAVKAAWGIASGAAQLNQSIKEKYGADVGFGVGVNCGTAIVGNIGPSFRKDYTAIGDTVNTAARLESNAKRSQVLISKEVRDRLGDRVDCQSVGEIPLKGKSLSLEVFQVTGVY